MALVHRQLAMGSIGLVGLYFYQGLTERRPSCHVLVSLPLCLSPLYFVDAYWLMSIFLTPQVLH